MFTNEAANKFVFLTHKQKDSIGREVCMSPKLTWRDLLIILLDIIAVIVSYLVALYARFYGITQGELFNSYLSAFWRFAPFYTVICIAIFAYFKLYGGMWKYAGMNDLNRIILANIATCFVQVVGTFIVTKILMSNTDKIEPILAA